MLSLIIAGIFSCTERIEIELDSTYTRLVAYGTITTDSICHSVSLTKTTDYFYNQPAPSVSDARVVLRFMDTTVNLVENPEIPGKYSLENPLEGIPGTEYILEISDLDINEDGIPENYTARSFMPGIAIADSIRLERFVTPFFSGYQVLLFSPEPEGRNWYNYKLARNGTLLNLRLSDYTVQPDEFVQDNYIASLPVGFLDDTEDSEAVLPGDTILLEINSISEAYYKFITDAQSEIFGNNPLFSGPPANVSTNLSEGALGFFAAYSIDRIAVIARATGF